MKYVFIGGIPASGKSFLAGKVAKATGALHVSIDGLREEMSKNPELEPWVNLYWKLDEEQYYNTTPCEEQWNNLVKQSEAFWPSILKKVKDVQKSGQFAIFEGVNILPHLAAKDFDFPGIFLLGSSFGEIFERNKRAPRWGNTVSLQKKEAEAFFNCERPNYLKEAKRCGYKTFTDSPEAERELLDLLQ